PAMPQQSIFPVNLPSRNAHVDKNCQGCEAREQAGYNQNSTEELRRRRKIGQPAGKSEVAHVMYVFGEAAEDLGIAVRDHNRAQDNRSEEHTSELQSRGHLVCRLLLEKKKTSKIRSYHQAVTTTSSSLP